MSVESQVPPLLQKSTTKPRRSRRVLLFAAFLLVGSLFLVLALVVLFQLTRKDTSRDYAFLCACLFEDLPAPGAATIKPSAAEVQARIHLLISVLNRISWRDRQLAPISRDFALLIRRAEGIQKSEPKLSPIVFGTVEAALAIYTGQRRSLDEGGQQALKATETLWNAFVAVQKVYSDKHVLAIQLADLATQFSGPVTNAEIVASSFAEHRPGLLEVQTKDWLTLRNSSGQELRNCVVAVRLSDSRGNSYLNIYFVRDWQTDQRRVASYSSSDFPKDTVNGITRVDVALWSEECSMTAFTSKKPARGWPDLDERNLRSQ